MAASKMEVTRMPVAVRDKVRAVSKDLGGQASLARMLGVSPSRVSRWLRTEQPDPENRRKVEGVEFVLGRLLDIYERDTALKWLQGFNAHLGNRQPIYMLGMGRVAEVLAAIEAEETLAYA
jgi:uncharacterized protein (DUF2384 family)